jgi:hypothetical protein
MGRFRRRISAGPAIGSRPGEHGVEGAGEFAVPVPDQVREAMPGFFEVGGEVPG